MSGWQSQHGGAGAGLLAVLQADVGVDADADKRGQFLPAQEAAHDTGPSRESSHDHSHRFHFTTHMAPIESPHAQE